MAPVSGRGGGGGVDTADMNRSAEHSTERSWGSRSLAAEEFSRAAVRVVSLREILIAINEGVEGDDSADAP